MYGRSAVFDYSSLTGLKDFSKGWSRSNGSPVGVFSPWEYLYHSSSLHQATAFTSLFFPSFARHDDLVFLAAKFDQGNYESLLGGGASPLDAAALINHVHVVWLFAEVEDPVDTLPIVHLAKSLRDSWNWALSKQYPKSGACFMVEGPPYDPELVLHQGESESQ
jgi:hypothetical protein